MAKRRGGFTGIEMSIILAILLALAAILLPVFTRKKGGDYPRRMACASNLKQVGIAFMQYAQEYDEQMPPVKLNARPGKTRNADNYKPFGWADALYIYLKSDRIFQCPSEPQTVPVSDPTQSGYTDYWYNTNLSKLKLEKFVSPAQTLMAGDGNDGTENTDARYSLNRLPAAWITTKESPARRHLDTGNYLFADGHVKALKPEAISNLPTNQSKSTFSFR